MQTEFPDDVQTDVVFAGEAPRSASASRHISPETPKRSPRRCGSISRNTFASLPLEHCPGGVGKSTLLTAEALAMVSVKPLPSVLPVDRLRVALWNGEDPMYELIRKVEMARKYYRLGPEDMGDQLFLDSGGELQLVEHG